MSIHRMQRVGAWAGLAAAMAFAMPVLPASAATPGQPTALTITPQLAARYEAKRVASAEASEGLVQVAQNNNVIRPQQRQANRNQAQRQRQANRNQAQRQREANRNQARRQGQVNRNQAQRQRQVNRNQAYRNQAYRDRVYHNGRWWRYNNGYYYDDNGAWLAAGAIGLAAGAIAGAAIANQNNTVVVEQPGGYYPAPFSSDWYRQCSMKYRSFRASDGTYLGYDGVRHQCRLP
ncbi:BA14K family protein [Acuticoccus sp. M5D2P5]|uniref:BA14K family protein n=1 Tax=Acuticoccus kalidii TaxID=2910977 RepID=UPI001F4149EB|nr:BA14K family protein [Acuticoccus kalidii]MCF3933663.1 BA14K family protein [Acuticoccus kalidii]